MQENSHTCLLSLGQLLLDLTTAGEAKVAQELLVNTLGRGEAEVLGLLDPVAVILLVLHTALSDIVKGRKKRDESGKDKSKSRS